MDRIQGKVDVTLQSSCVLKVYIHKANSKRPHIVRLLKLWTNHNNVMECPFRFLFNCVLLKHVSKIDKSDAWTKL